LVDLNSREDGKIKKLVIRVDPERRSWWKETVSKFLPDLEILLWDEDKYLSEEISYAVVWAPPFGGLAKLINLECVLSVGAGISHIIDDPTYPRHVPIIRTVNDALRQRMSEYVALHVLRIHRRLPEIEESAKQASWNQFLEPIAQEIQVGIMGMGNLGAAAAKTLLGLGYRVRGWSRRGSPVEGVDVYGFEALDDFLEGNRILISILPATCQTENILNEQTISKLPRGSWIINAGRGTQINDLDLLCALDSGHLSGAVLDVFRQEPLPKESAFWNHSKILITCHTASAIEPAIGGKTIADNLLAFIRNEAVNGLVNIEQGY
jgi:glyoxylate/hydroxypyruvate reductase A